jgi:multiple antibiotic resistance protein
MIYGLARKFIFQNGQAHVAVNQGSVTAMSPTETFLYDLLRTTIALFIIVDPIGTVPAVFSLTRDMGVEEKRRNFKIAAYTGSALLVVFAVAGQQILTIFGISLYSFMIAGGILLLLLSMDILIRGESAQRTGSVEDIGAVPIAIPLLVGPGAITTTIVQLQYAGYTVVLLSIMIVMFLTWLILRTEDTLYRLLGQNGSAVVAKLMAVFIAAIAVEYILTGIQFYYPSKS